MPKLHSKLSALAALISLLGQASAIDDSKGGKGGKGGKGSLEDIEHVVLFMQENRPFDHYFGTMAGVRGFNDANVQMNGEFPVWSQLADPSKTSAKRINPWYINYLGGNWSEATQCMTAGSNGWQANHLAYNGGLMDHWALNNTPYSIGFYKRQDLPVHFALAEGWMLADMYQEAVMASTNPNRVTWVSGSVNVPGGPQKPDQGGNPYIDNNESPDCDGGQFNCFPLKWKTTGEYYQEAGLDWQVFQDADNFDDNDFVMFEQFRNAKSGDPLFERGVKGQTLDDFDARAANGTLPAISYIVAAAELSEHPPFSPNDGSWLQNRIVQSVIKSPTYSKTVLIISYDETGGWADHVKPYTSPEGTPGEWIDDPYKLVGHTFAGPGYRLPFYIISPWTRKGGVYTGHCDHNSQIKFIEAWQAAKGKNVVTKEMGQWRRNAMSDLVDAFDFENPDYSLPSIPVPPEPHRDSKGNFDGSSFCQSRFPHPNPPVPYTGEGVIKDMSSVVEKGFKPVRGPLTEGRFLVFEMLGFALTQFFGIIAAPGIATPKHDNIEQRWIVHAVEIGGQDFKLSTARGGQWLCGAGLLCKDETKALVLTITFEASKGYALNLKGTRSYVIADSKGYSERGSLGYWQIYSVNY